MKTETFQLEFITPCFCAGADQAKAEVRAPTIRGKLRWWFRVLGGTADQEAEVFGSIRGEEGCASSLIVRVRANALATKWQPINFSDVTNTGYVLYFAKASADGARWVQGGALSAGSSFDLQLTWRRKPGNEVQLLFDLARDCFLMLGSLGLRSTRGLGSFACNERPFSESDFSRLFERIKAKSPSFLAGLASFDGPESRILDALGAQLRGLRQGYSAGRPGHSNPTPLGSSSNPRQTSAVYLRPVRKSADRYRLVVFEAPADKALGRESRNGAPLLGNGVPPPGAPRSGVGRRTGGWR
jgi:CRISPR-associated protein Cmr1